MGVRITLRDAAPGEKVVGGILFTDGAAHVPTLGDHARKTFYALGARVQDDRPRKPKPEDTTNDGS